MCVIIELRIFTLHNSYKFFANIYANTYSFKHLDINECVLGTSGCNQLCNNTVGSYTCSCNTGYTLDLNNLTCNGECHHSYANCHTDTKINVDRKLSRHC